MRISCLPLAGPHNPYQRLMMAGLRKAGHTVVYGKPGRFLALTRTALGQRPQAIHLDWPGSYYLRSNTLLCYLQEALFELDLALLRLTGVPLVWTAHNLSEHDTHHAHIDHRAKRSLARLARRVRIFSQVQLEEAADKLDILPDKLVALPEGSYIGHYPETQTREEARAALGLPPQARVILHFGNLRPYKGSSHLIHAFLQTAGPDDRLVLAGPAHTPHYVEHLRHIIGDDTRVLLHPGFVPEEKVQTYFHAADVAAFPFDRIDNSGTVILAMGFGLACLAPADGAVQARLHTQRELLFTPGDLTGHVQTLLTLPAEQLKAIGRRNREEVLQYRWEDFGPVFNNL